MADWQSMGWLNCWQHYAAKIKKQTCLFDQRQTRRWHWWSPRPPSRVILPSLLFPLLLILHGGAVILIFFPSRSPLPSPPRARSLLFICPHHITTRAQSSIVDVTFASEPAVCDARPFTSYDSETGIGIGIGFSSFFRN